MSAHTGMRVPGIDGDHDAGLPVYHIDDDHVKWLWRS